MDYTLSSPQYLKISEDFNKLHRLDSISTKTKSD